MEARAQIDMADEPFETTDRYQELKFRMFDLTLERLETRGVSAKDIPATRLAREIEMVAQSYRSEDTLALNADERRRLVSDVLDEIVGLGPLEPMLKDDTVDDIVVNGAQKIYVERRGRMEPVRARFRDDKHLLNIIHRIIGPIGRRVDENMPFVDARLADGSRVNAMIPPVALDGPTLSIRKFKKDPLKAEDLLRGNALTKDMLTLLGRLVRGRQNILIIGGTGAGKTTLLNIMSGYIGERERVLTIEDAAELQIRQSHVVRAETRPGNADGAREISSREILKNALRMRPDRIILGEVRGGEAVDMLQAMSTGHPGSMATIHANSVEDALARLEMLLSFGGFGAEPSMMRRFVANSIDLVVEVQRLSNGVRRIVAIGKVAGVRDGNYDVRNVWSFNEKPPLSGEGTFECDRQQITELEALLPAEEGVG